MNRMIKDTDLKQSIALYSNKWGSVSVNDVSSWIEEHEDYVRISEAVDIEFIALADEVVLEHRVTAIDKQIEKTRAEMTRKITELTDQKQRLIAIVHQADVA